MKSKRKNLTKKNEDVYEKPQLKKIEAPDKEIGAAAVSGCCAGCVCELCVGGCCGCCSY